MATSICYNSIEFGGIPTLFPPQFPGIPESASQSSSTTTMPSIATKYPVVLIHGVFGYGATKPLWNTWSPYWPEKALHELNPNHVLLHVGALSSNHDRACEAFYQLYGGQVDYGNDHSLAAGHERYGATYTSPLHPTWSASNPVHLVGHSFGGTTALELYQLICSDFFQRGTDSRWVRSLIAIASPLTGSTMPHLFGLHEPRVAPFSLGHVIGAILGVWFKLHTDFPLLRRVFDFQMPQWECVTTFREILSPNGRINRSTDLAVFNLLPKERLKRNSQLIDMDKLFLLSVATSSHVSMPYVELALLLLILGFAMAATISFLSNCIALTTFLLLNLIGTLWSLRRRAQTLDYASIPSLYALSFIMRRHVRMLHMIFDGFDREMWSDNDGAVNLHSMLRPWATTKKGWKEQPLDPLDPTRPVNAFKLTRGTWYVHCVQKNHMAGTHFDSDSAAFFKRLFQLMVHHFESQDLEDLITN